MATNARLEELKKKFDENPRRYFAPLANEYRKQGDLTQAITLCRAHLPNQPGHISGHIVLAQALYEARELPESRQIFEQALELDPENLIALRSLGDIARAQDDVAAARSWYERVLDADPRNDEITTLLRELAAEPVVVAAAPVEAFESEAPAPTVIAAEPAPLASEPQEPAWDPDKTPIANVAIPEHPVATVDAPEALPADDSSDIFGEGTVDQGAELLESFEPTELKAEAAVEASEPAPIDAFELDLPELTAAAPESPASEIAQPEAEGAAVAESSPASQPESEFVEDASAFAAAQELSDPEALPEPMGDDWFNAPTPPRGVVRQYEPEVPTEPATPQTAPLTLQIPTPAEGATAQSTSVDLGTFDLIEAGSSAPADLSPPSQAIEEEHPASWFDAPVESSQPTVELTQPIDEPSQPTAELTEQALDLEPADFSTSEPEAQETPIAGESAIAEVEAEATAESPSAEPSEEDAAIVAAAAQATEEFEIRAEATSVLQSEDAEQDAAHDMPPSVELEGEPEPEAIDRGMTDREDVFGSITLHDEPVDEDSSIPADLALASTLADPALGRMAPEDAATESETPQMFVTETMAELYLQQGFTDEALGIYRKLLEQNPGDEGIQARIVALESGAVSTVEAAADAAHLIDRHGQSVRTFFGRVASHRPRRRAAVASSALDVSSLGAQYANRASATEFEVQPSALSKLFSAAPQAPADDAAATQLASAFTADAVGRPTRAADSELSLDHLFRDVPPESSSAVTLDAFFAAPGGDAASLEADGLAPEERTGDIEQFTAWLEGLKKK